MLFSNFGKKNYFVEEDFIELKDSVKELIDVIERYKDMRKDSDEYILELKEFLKEVNLVLEEKNLTKKELTNLHYLGESYFDSRIDNSIYSYYVYDKNNLEKTHQANDEIGIAKKRLGKILYKINEKVMYHMIQQKYKNKGKLNRHDFTDKDVEEQD